MRVHYCHKPSTLKVIWIGISIRLLKLELCKLRQNNWTPEDV